MIVRLALSLLLLLAPTQAAALSPDPAPLPPAGCTTQGGVMSCALSGPATLRPATSESLPDDLVFTIRSLIGSDGLGVSIRDGRLLIADGLLAASIGCNTLSAPVEIDSDGRISITGQPISTAKFCPDLDEQEQLLSAILLGRGLTLDAAALTLSSENGAAALRPVEQGDESPAPVPTPTPVPTTDLGSGMGGAMHETHCREMGGCRGSDFLAAFATAAIALALFSLGFFLGLQSDRRGGLLASRTPSAPSASVAPTAPAKPAARAKRPTKRVAQAPTTTPATTPPATPKTTRPAKTPATQEDAYRV